MENNEQLLPVKLRMNAMLSWEDHSYIGPPHVLNPQKAGALVEVVRDNILCYEQPNYMH